MFNAISKIVAVVGITVALAAQATPASAATYLGPVGGNGGVAQGIYCDQGEVIVGLRVRVGSFVDQVKAECATFSGSTRGTVWDAYGVIGGSGGSLFGLRCGYNKALVGFQGRASSLVDALSIACARLNSNGTINWDTLTWSNHYGGSGGSKFGKLTCPNRPVYKITGRGGWYVDQLTLICL